MDTLGRHLLAEYHGCDPSVLDDLNRVENLMNEAAVAAKATVVQSAFHLFRPQGVSGVVIVQESHLSIHTWPELGYAAVDFYTCGDCEPEQAHAWLARALKAQRCDLMVVERGLRDRVGSSMAVVRNDVESTPPRPELRLATGG